MKDRGKAVVVSDHNYSSSSSDLPCRKHPNSSSVGICAYCLKDRLVKLVCSDCGEQRLSSCSCSDISSSYPNSCIVEVGSVGRVSFLIENDKDNENNTPINANTKTFEGTTTTTSNSVLLKRSSSSSIDVKRSTGFWRFGKFFRKKRGIKGISGLDDGDHEVDDKSEIWVSDHMGVSRSKSVCGIRGTTTTTSSNGVFDCHSEVGFGGLSTRVSDVNKDWHSETERRSGGFSGGVIKNKYGFGLIDIIDGEDEDNSAGFIDLKLGFSSESKPTTDFSCRRSSATDFNESSESGFRLSKESDFSEVLLESHSFEYPRGQPGDQNSLQYYSCGGSCRITVNDHNNKEMKKKCKKSSKVWKWILKHQSSSATAATRD